MTDSDKDRSVFEIAFVGGGINSAVGNTHRIASQMDNYFRLVAGCFSRDREINKSTFHLWLPENGRLYNHYSELFQNEKGRIDAVVVLTPSDAHGDIVKEALTYGYPVVCEKPLTNKLEETDEIIDILERRGGFLAVIYNYTGYPAVREAKNLIKKGLIGEIIQIVAEMPQEGFLRVDSEGKPIIPQKWRLKDSKILTISLDLGVHLHHLIWFLTGSRPLEVVAKTNTYGHFKEIIDNVMCIARYTNNIDCIFWYSKSALGNRNGLRIRIFGREGSIEWYQMEPEYLYIADNKGHIMLLERACVDSEIATQLRYNRFKSGHPAGFIEAFANLYADIYMSLSLYKSSFQGDVYGEYVANAYIVREGLRFL